MPKRLREHLRSKEIDRESEVALYEWPCVRCEKVFKPNRVPEFIARVMGHEWERFCGTCQIENLIEGICDDPNEQKEFREFFKLG